jgi:hypothetical protein
LSLQEQAIADRDGRLTQLLRQFERSKTEQKQALPPQDDPFTKLMLGTPPSSLPSGRSHAYLI